MRNPYATEYYADADKAAGVTAIHIPATVESIDPAFFQLFPNAASITVDPANSAFTSFNGMLFNEQLTDLLLAPEGMEGVAVLPESLAAVPAYVISRCNKLSGLSFQPGSTGTNAFAAQDGVLYTSDKTMLVAAPAGLGASVAIAPECTAILEGAFWGNDHLKTIVATGAVAAISVDAASSDAPAGILSIGSATGDPEAADTPGTAFEQATIQNATVITDNREAWEAAGFTSFAKLAEPGDTIAPAPGDSGLTYTLMENGQLSVKWTGEAPASGKRNIPSAATLHGVDYTVSVIEDGAFEGQDELTEIVLPDTITTIGTSAFAGCTALGSVQLAGSVTSIGASAFEGCTSLTAIALGGGLRTIGDSAFEGAALADVVLPASVQSIGDRAFAACEQLTAVVAQSSIPQVSETALADTAGVNVYAPREESGEYAWSIGPVASANHLLPYGVQPAQSIYELTLADTVNVFDNGGYLEAAGDAQTSVSYKGNAVSADATGAVHAKQPGTAAITYSINYKDLTLAKATCTAVVNTASQPDQPEVAESGDGSDAVSEDDAEGDSEGEEASEDKLLKDEEATSGEVEDGESVSDEGATEPSGDYEVGDDVSFLDEELLDVTADQFDPEMSEEGIQDNILNKDMNLTDISKDERDFGFGSAVIQTLSMLPFTAGLSESREARAAQYSSFSITINPDGGQLYYSVHSGNEIQNDASVFDGSRFNFGKGDIVTWKFRGETGGSIGVGPAASGQTRHRGSSHWFKSVQKTEQEKIANGTMTWGTSELKYRDSDGAIVNRKDPSYEYEAAKTDKLSGKKYYLYSMRCGRPGYDFTGWTYDEPGGRALSNRVAEIENGQTIFANWKAMEYSITFKKHNGSADSSLKATYDSALPVLTSKPGGVQGKSFAGYNTEEDGSGTWYYDKDLVRKQSQYTVDGNLTLHAVWTDNTYKIKFNNVESGASGGPSDKTVTYNSGLPVIPSTDAPKLENYVFMGYYTERNGGGQQWYNSSMGKGTGAPSTYTVANDTTLYAHWTPYKKKIYFDWNGGTGSVPAPVEVTYGEAMPPINSSKPTRAGYTFLGWYDTSGYDSTTGTRYYSETNASLEKWDKPQSYTSYTLYAHWGYNIDVIEPQGFRYTTAGAHGYLVDLAGAFIGTAYTPDYSSSYTFQGLYTLTNNYDIHQPVFNQVFYLSHNNYLACHSEYLAQNDVLYSVWTKTITLDANGGSLGDLKTVTAVVTGGGRDSSAMNELYFGPCAAGVNGSVSSWLWPPNSGASDNGDWSANWQPTKTNSQFKGYYDSTSPSGATLCIESGGRSTWGMTWPRYSVGPTSLYAQWEYVEYTIKYDRNGGTGTDMPSTKGYKGFNPTISKCTYSPPTGKHFAGWRKNNATTGDWVDGSTTSDTIYEGDLSTSHGAIVTLYAQWDPDVYTLTLEQTNATTEGTKTIYVKYGDGFYLDQACKNKITEITKPQRKPGYTYAGHTAITNAEGKITASNTAFTGSRSFSVNWTANVYTIELSNKGADKKNGTSAVYLKYDDGYYSDQACTAANKLTKITPPERYGYDFVKYDGLTNANGDITASAQAFTEDKTGNKALDPQWSIYTCTVWLYPNWSGSPDTPKKVEFDFTQLGTTDSAAQIKLTNPFERPHWSFTIWNESPDGQSDSDYDQSVITAEFARRVADCENHTLNLYAQWSQEEFNLTLIANGGSPVGPMWVQKGSLLPTLKTERPGYTLVDWCIDEELTQRWDLETDKMPADDLTLYAKWEHNTFTVTFDPGKGEGKRQTEEYTYEAVDENGKPASQHLKGIDQDLGFSRVGGKFLCWTLEENPDLSDSSVLTWQDKADVRTGLAYDGDVTLYAQWEPIIYPIIYMPNPPADGTVNGNMSLQSVPYVFPETLPPHPTVMEGGFTCEGYTFTGWNTAVDGSGYAVAPGTSTTDELTLGSGGSTETTTLQELAITSGNGNHIVLFAQWKGAPYQVRFEANPPEGETVEGTMEDQTLYWGLADNLKPNEFKVSGGWTFGTWNTKPDGSGTTYTNGQLVRNLRPEEGQDMPTLYAQWDVVFSVDVPTVDHINVTMNTEGEWITVDSADVTVRSYSPRPVGIQGITCEGTDGLGQILQDTSQANQLVLNLNSQGITVPLSAGTTSTDPNFYFKLEEGSAADPATLPLNVDLATRNADIQLIEHVEPITAFRLTFLLGVVED